MRRANTIQHHPLPLRNRMHERQSLVRPSMALTIAMLAVSIAALTVPMVRDAIAGHAAPLVGGTEAITTTALPREWSWTREPITFDHMFRQSEPHASISFTRGAGRNANTSRWR